MKKAIKTFLVVVAVATTTHIAIAQTPYDDFAPSNKKKEMLKLPEVKFTVTSKDSGYIIFDKDNHSLTYYSKNDSIYGVYALAPNNYKWLSVDPEAKKYPSHSPYNFVTNNPLNAIDPDGRDVVFLIDKQGAGNNGHMAMLFQDAKGNWYHFSQGAAEQGSTSGMVSNSGYAGGIMIQPMITKNTAGDIVQMTKEQAIAMVNSGRVDGNAYDENITLKTTNKQDAQITANANKLQQAYQNGTEQYRLMTNNCVDAVQDAVQGDKGIKTGITLPSDATTPKPNSYYDLLKSSVPWLNGDLKLEYPKSGLDNYQPKPIVVPNLQTTPAATGGN